MGIDSITIVSDAEWVEARVASMKLEAEHKAATIELAKNFMFDLTSEGRPAGAPEMSFLKHKDVYEYPGGVY